MIFADAAPGPVRSIEIMVVNAPIHHYKPVRLKGLFGSTPLGGLLF
jgi:hypothetical protein